VCEFLVDRGADVTALDSVRYRVQIDNLHASYTELGESRGKSSQLISLVCVCRMQEGRSVLHYAAEYGHEGVCDTLMVRGVNITATDNVRICSVCLCVLYVSVHT
jgi:Ankyrin repeat